MIELTRSIEPGSWLDRPRVARELGMSLAPVNSAVLRLETEGFLETLPQRGTRVRVPELNDIRGQLVVREALEAEAARLYCGQPVVKARSRLEELANAMASGSNGREPGTQRIQGQADDGRPQRRRSFCFNWAGCSSSTLTTAPSTKRKTRRSGSGLQRARDQTTVCASSPIE